MEQSTGHSGLVHLHLGVDGQHGVFPDPHCQAGQGCCCFANGLVEFGIQGVIARLLFGAELCEVLDSLECELKSLAEMLGVLLTSWPVVVIFLRLLVKPNSLLAWEKQ